MAEVDAHLGDGLWALSKELRPGFFSVGDERFPVDEEIGTDIFERCEVLVGVLIGELGPAPRLVVDEDEVNFFEFGELDRGGVLI